jgi:carboxypeptidase PM20D1
VIKGLLRTLGLVLLLLVGLVAVLAVNAFRHASSQVDVPPAPLLAVDEAAAAGRLAEAIRLRTVSSRSDPAQNADQFQALQDLLQTRYPLAHALLKRELVGGLSLLYTWPGSDPSAQPILLMAHQDVVPIASGTERDWAEPPFGGVVKDGFIWGRGAWDNKANLISQMEAVELLAASGFKPKRSILLAFGADEEVGGLRGAQRIAALLEERGVRLDFVIDEGMLITEGLIPGLARPAALVGIAEKGYLSVVLKVSATPGHSSMPPAPGSSAIAMLSAALTALDDHQLPAAIRGVAAQTFQTLAPEMPLLNRVVLSNLWLFAPVVRHQLAASASTNANLRTTTALTMLQAGDQDNVLPGRAEATVNFRLLPGDSQAAVIDHVKLEVGKAIGPGRFELQTLPGASEPSRVSATESPSYRLIERTLRELFPGTLVAPGLMIGATDSRHFEGLSDHIYRFSPVRAKPADLARFHGTNERISTANLAEMIRFYHRLLTQGAGGA